MLTVTNTKPIIKPNNINNKSCFSKNFSEFQDKVSFKGAIIRPAKNSTEIKELVNLFYDAIKHNFEPKKSSTKLFEKLDRYICAFPFIWVAKKSSSVNEIILSENKIVGGYSMNVYPLKSTAHIGFITLAPEYMKTKSGIEFLKIIGKRICQNSEINNVKELTWTTNSKNKQINRTLKRFNPETVRKIASETEYRISLEDFKAKLLNL